MAENKHPITFDQLEMSVTKIKEKFDSLAQIYAPFAAVGAPFVASYAADMEDITRVYVYVGSEGGMVNGNWYYFNGTAWVSGGPYNSTAFVTDTDLTEGGMAADAEVVGVYFRLLCDVIPDTTQEYTFTNGTVSAISHESNGSPIRTDTFTYGDGTITETRTLYSGESLTIETDLTTLETEVTYSAS